MAIQAAQKKDTDRESTYEKGQYKRKGKGGKVFIITREIDADKAVSLLDKRK